MCTCDVCSICVCGLVLFLNLLIMCVSLFITLFLQSPPGESVPTGGDPFIYAYVPTSVRYREREREGGRGVAFSWH